MDYLNAYERIRSIRYQKKIKGPLFMYLELRI